MSHLIVSSETSMLIKFLDNQRNHVLGILEGLDEETLRRPILPSGWSCLGMLGHLALDVERFWFQCVVAGDQDAIRSLDDIHDAWKVGPDVPAESMFTQYRQQIALSNEIIASRSIESEFAWWPDDAFGDWRMENVRQLVLHVMTETACHAGHLDAVRELIDGRKWMVQP